MSHVSRDRGDERSKRDGSENQPDRLAARDHQDLGLALVRASATTPELLKEDLLIKRYLKKRLYQAGISKITIERKGDRITIGIRTARPGLVIGRKGEQVDKLSEEMKPLTKKVVQLNIEEIKRADLDAQLVAEHIAKQLEQRVSFRRAMKKAIASSMRAGAQGIRVACVGPPGRLRDGALRDLPRGPRAASHAARGHRFRARHGASRRTARAA